jgi:arylsulfatase A-like enzyme
MGHYNQPPKWFGPSPIKTNLPELLRSQGGYHTGVICKNPTAQGWDYEATHLDTGLGRDPAKYGQITKKFIETAVAAKKPFFLHANSMDPHEYWAGQKHETKAWIEAMMMGKKYETHPNGKPYPDPQRTYSPEQVPVPACWPDNAAIREDIYTYYNSVRRLDDTVGAILRALKETGQEQNTLVVFISDHGIGRAFAKWSMYPLGTRTPMIVRWPGVVQPGSRSTVPTMSMDWLPTFVAAGGGSIDLAYPSDGVDIRPALTGGALPERPLFWRYRNRDQRAYRLGDYKYLKINENEFLFDVVADPLERANLKNRQPERFAAMRDAWEQWDAGMLHDPTAQSGGNLPANWADHFNSPPPPPRPN